MSWQRAARWIVAVIGIGCAVAIFVSTRRRPPPPPPPELAKVDRSAALEAGAGQTIIYREGRSPITHTFRAMRRYEDGRSESEGVRLEGLEGSRFTIRAGAMDTVGSSAGADRPSRLDLKRSVVLVTDDGLELKSETATWDDPTSLLTMPGAVSFTKGRLSGSGVGAAYDRVADAFTLLDQASAHVAPDPAGGSAVDATSTRMTLARGHRTLQLDGGARIVMNEQTLTANAATLSFTDGDRIKYLELRGAANVAPNPGAAPDTPAMSGDNITMAFQGDGLTLQHATVTGHAGLDLGGAAPRSIRASWIDLFTARDGRTLTRLQARDGVVVSLAATAETPARRITSATLSASGTEAKGLTSARFEGKPRFEEAPADGAGRGGSGPAANARAGTSTVLVLTLGGRIDAIERAEFQQNAEFKNGDVTGWADVAQYEEARGLLRLVPNPREPRRRSGVQTANMTVAATTIDVYTNTDDLLAQGAVTTLTTPEPGGTAERRPALFGGDEPIFGDAETLRFTQSTGTAVYTGTPQAQARLRQGESEVVADRVEFTDRTHNLSGDGRVYSQWLLESTDAAAGPPSMKKYRVRAETLRYDEAARTAVYRGTAATMTTVDSEVEAGVLTFQLAASSRALDSMRAERAVWAQLAGGYEAVGDVLVYRAGVERYTLEGLAEHETAQVKSPGSDSPSSKPDQCKLNVGMKLELNKRTGLVSVPGVGQAPRDVTEVSCSLSLRRGK